MKCIGIIGSRRRNTEDDYLAVVGAFESVFEVGDRIASGGCPQGADSFAERIAKSGITITIHYPDWIRNGHIAGILRNTLIAEDADILITCVSKDRTGGTEDTIRQYRKLGKDKVILV